MKHRLDLTRHNLSRAGALETLSDKSTLKALSDHMLTYVRWSFPGLAVEAEDIVMEAILSIYVSLSSAESKEQHIVNMEKFQMIGSLESLVRKAVMNKAIDRQRSMAYRTTVNESAMSHVDDINTFTLFEQTLFDKELLLTAMENLNKVERTIFQASLDGWTLQEIAKNYGITPQRVFQLKKRATDKLRAFLQHTDPDILARDKPKGES